MILMSRFVPVSSRQASQDETSLEFLNQVFWSSLLGHVQRDIQEAIQSILDVGCDCGGLLARLGDMFHPETLTGIEPSKQSRERALFRLRTLASTVTLLPPGSWGEISPASVDLITCHEVLHLVPDIDLLFAEMSRTLRKDGTAFVVSGSHTENPLWGRWSEQLRADGQTVFDRSPFDILRSGINAGLKGALRPLRRDGWVIYDPDRGLFNYSSVEELFDHHYRHKLLFRFIKQS